MKKFVLNVTPEHSGKEIKQILRGHYRFSSRLITALKKNGSIMLNGLPVTVRAVLRSGDILTLSLPDTASESIAPVKMPLDILFEDEDILAVCKPSGMPTHPSHGHHENTLANGVCAYFSSGSFTFRAVTRLDKDTTGVVLIAKNQYSAAALSEQLKGGELRKAYTAICVGKPPEGSGVVNAPIARDPESVIKRCVDSSGKAAVTHYEIIAEGSGLSLVRLLPITGRTHQIRVHMAYIGCPLYGDFLYGREIPGERTRLHCSSVTLTHPTGKGQLTISAPLPQDFDIFHI